MPKTLSNERRYLIAVYIQEANFLIRWLFCRWAWFAGKYENHIRNKVNGMTEGEVLRRYYEKTGRRGYDIGVSKETIRNIDL